MARSCKTAFPAPPYSLITVLSSLRYLAVGIFGLLSLRLLGGAARAALAEAAPPGEHIGAHAGAGAGYGLLQLQYPAFPAAVPAVCGDGL